LKDQETRYRQRYLDLIMNPTIRDTFLVRSQVTGPPRIYAVRLRALLVYILPGYGPSSYVRFQVTGPPRIYALRLQALSIYTFSGYGPSSRIRYLDMIMIPSVRDTVLVCSQVMRHPPSVRL